MSGQAEETEFYRALVAIETDATQYYGAHASRPQTLDRSDAKQMLSHIAADLKALLPEVSNCSLIAAGAIFDQTQILRPGYPVFEALEATPTSRRSEGFRPGLVSIGAEQGSMPIAELQPLEDIPLGLLQLLPLTIQGPPGLVESLGESMEYRFLEEGQISAHSAAWLESAFGISITHARLMTLTDLNAMLRLQLEHFGFLPLWELLDAALNGNPETLRVESDCGNVYEWRDGAVYTRFETFDHWASQGRGAGMLTERQMLAGGYGDWTRETRQFLTTLRAHGLEVLFQEPGSDNILEGSFYAEDTGERVRSSDSSLTEHSFEELGTVAITFVEGERIFNYYPLRPRGLNEIHAHLRDKVPGGHTVAFPGTILYDEKSRRLIPDPHE